MGENLCGRKIANDRLACICLPLSTVKQRHYRTEESNVLCECTGASSLAREPTTESPKPPLLSWQCRRWKEETRMRQSDFRPERDYGPGDFSRVHNELLIALQSPERDICDSRHNRCVTGHNNGP